MNFQELVDAVVTDTNRPDMDSSRGGDGQIQQKVASATLYLHSLDFFFKDIRSAQVVFDNAAYIQQIDTTEIPRFRSIKYLRKNDPSKELVAHQQNPSILPPLMNSAGAVNIMQSMAPLTIIPPDKFLDEFGYKSEMLDVAYQAGDDIIIKSSSAVKTALLGYYQFPNVDTSNNGANFSSWIARDFPYAIVAIATSAIFTNVGKQEASRKLDGPGGEVERWTRAILISGIEADAR